MKRILLVTIFSCIFLTGCAGKLENFQENGIYNDSEMSTQDQSEQSGMELKAFPLGEYRWIDALVYLNKDKFYTQDCNQLKQVDTHEFVTDFIYADQVYSIKFLWCNVEGNIYAKLDETSSDGFVIQTIPGCTDVVLLCKTIRQVGTEAVFMCDLSQQKTTLLTDKEKVGADAIDSVLVSKDLNQAIINIKDGVSVLLHDGADSITLDKLFQNVEYERISAKFVEDKVLCMLLEYEEGSPYKPYISCYLYNAENKSVIQTINKFPLYHQMSQPNGLTFKNGRYAFISSGNNKIMIIDILKGTSVNTGINSGDITQIQDASDSLFAVIYNTGEISLIEKESGKFVKRAKFNPGLTLGIVVRYKDEKLYIHNWESDKFEIYQISEFDYSEGLNTSVSEKIDTQQEIQQNSQQEYLPERIL